MKRKSSLLVKYERPGWIPISMIFVGIVLAYIAEPLGAYWGQLAFLGALVLIFSGVPLLFLYLVVYVAIWILRRVGTTTGVIVEEPDLSPRPEPVATGPSWRVTLPDGPHRVSFENESPHPSRLVCDGRWVELTWPFKWRGRPEAVFTISGHRATLVEAPDLGRTISPKNLFGLGGPGSLRYRRDLRVDGATVEPHGVEAPGPRI